MEIRNKRLLEDASDWVDLHISRRVAMVLCIGARFAAAAPPLLPFRLRIVRETSLADKLNYSQCIRGSVYQTATFDDPTADVRGMTWLADCIELPWRSNAGFVSSIPQGRYTARVRTDGNLGWRIELLGTQPRTAVEIHLGSFPIANSKNTEGCIIVGKRSKQDPCWLEQSPKYREEIRKAYNDTSNTRQIEIQILEKQ